MTKEQQADIARAMTGSNLSNEGIFIGVLSISETQRDSMCIEVHPILEKHNLPFDKAFPLFRADFNKIAIKYSIDPAVLFWVYMEWLNKQNK